MAGRTAACVGQDEIGCVGAHGEDHVAGVVAYFGIGMRGKVVEEHVAGSLGVLGGRCLAVGDFVEGDYDSRIAAT